MITRKATLTILIIAIVVLLAGCIAKAPQFSVTESAHEILVCSDTANDYAEIVAHVAATYEYGESDGIIWEPTLYCVVYHK